MGTLAHPRKTNPGMARKEKRSSIGGDILMVSGGKHLRQEIEESLSLSSYPNTTSQFSHYDAYVWCLLELYCGWVFVLF